MKCTGLLPTTLAFLLLGCGTPEPLEQGVPPSTHTVEYSAFPAYTVFPSTEPLPKHLVDALPQKIQNLPVGSSLSLEELVRRLGLSGHKENVSANFRWSTYFMHLGEHHILHFACIDPSWDEDWPRLETKFTAIVRECRLMQAPNIVLSERLLEPDA